MVKGEDGRNQRGRGYARQGERDEAIENKERVMKERLSKDKRDEEAGLRGNYYQRLNEYASGGRSTRRGRE